ncbi:hypothetical protein [Embleya hyalina]|uniref:Uncharacterized protein n=1 Tax=Embleya hyalina TaxID=516124 RepID=A0A401YZ45_9ACTN|nr:hypothetical protein [Embleya hyalina]GCD99858.1 hypothetical protein EHYA_07580 [Embleya hyalina]
MAAKKTFVLHMLPSWERPILASTETHRLVETTTEDILRLARQGAPRSRGGRYHWNSIRNHLSSAVLSDLDGYFGQVIVEFDPRVRHAMLQELGYRDLRGSRHPGRLYLKAALEKARIE